MFPGVGLGHTKGEWIMKTRGIVRGMALVSCVMVAAGAVWAQGSLTPPGAPGPTMRTLDQVEPRTAVQTLSGSGTAMHVITQPGSYYLTGSITADAEKSGIVVECDNVSIDFCGFTLAGAGKTVGSAGYGISAPSSSNLIVRNGILRQFRTEGIYCSNGDNLLVENMMVENCGGVGIHGYSHATVRNTICWQNGGYGILANGSLLCENCLADDNDSIGIGASGSGSVIRGCVARHNDGVGISTGAGSVIADCTADHNSATGIHGNSGSTIRGCSAYTNTGMGISVGDGCLVVSNTTYANTTVNIQGANRNLIRENNSNNSPCGIKVTATDNVVEGNLVTNCTEGINLFGSASLYANNRLSNTTNYVNQGDDTDGGGNIVF